MDFTTRPELAGTFGMVSATHWTGAQAGMAMLEHGGNAFDAAAAAGFALQAAEPQQNGPGGDMTLIFAEPGQAPRVLSAQGPAPASATPAAFRALGLGHVPGTGLLAAAIPGSTLGWLRLLADHGTLALADVLGPALAVVEDGLPVSARLAAVLERMAPHFRQHWPSSAAVYAPGGRPLAAGSLLRNPALARTWRRLVEAEVRAAAGGAGRAEAIDAAVREWTTGFVAEAIDAFCRTPQRDSSGTAHAGLITAADLAAWRPHYEPTVSLDFRGWTVHKCGFFSQGPAFLQQLAILDAVPGFGEGTLAPGTEGYLHTVLEATKLALADRDAWYGDGPGVPAEELLSPGYAAARAALIGATATLELLPGSPGGRMPRLPDLVVRGGFEAAGVNGLGEPNAVRALQEATAADGLPAADGKARTDTVHVDVVDRWGNMVSATPSGGWLSSSPVIPELGFPLGTRLQMAWLEEGLPNTLAPGRRPRTTLSPSLATRGGEAVLAFGSPGGDQQDQWQPHFFLDVALRGVGLQEAIDAPGFHSVHSPSSFYPHEHQPGVALLEGRFGADVVEGLRRRGHRVGVAGDWEIGRLCAVARDPATGILRAGANPRGMAGYAVGR
ncbi:gamma-glutamyltranspeptidase/glutathione hydrolase [Sinomonas atrocyanea]|uniref:gamma-glutamyltransferase family protein n=1 Tax=Sinomonas atrocyanea TaxID=37927 RepID=UPI00277FE920|nr:gamma-glutamyltransferase [Sinomonas atrocyanea]MDP9885218.1 gamma-glutamyltranspeptidase/glutathione hydrolase [Sinomonas atrocyanea]